MLFAAILIVIIFLSIVLGPFLGAMGLKWTKENDGWRRRAFEEIQRNKRKK